MANNPLCSECWFYHNHNDNNIYPSPVPPEHSSGLTTQDDSLPKESEWNGFMLVAAIACVCTVFMITMIVYYVYCRSYSNSLRQFERRSRRRIVLSQVRRFSWRPGHEFMTRSPRENGLCSEAMEALPVFVYEPRESFNEGLRCSVCLCDFQEGEKAKLLPNCNHSFHVDCIDMWFSSHSNCPLCRASVGVQPNEPADSDRGHVEITVREDGQADPCNEGLEQKDNDDESKVLEETSRADVSVDIPAMEK